jgi:CheY-like chemotaxis protein
MSSKKILVIEDDMVTQKVIADSLRSAGYEVVTARDGSTAVQQAREHKPDLITLDIKLAKESPEDTWDGFSVARWLQRITDASAMPALIVVSALEPEEIVENAAAVGAYSFLPKPFSKQKLLELVAEALASKSAPSQGEDGH